MSIGLIFWVLMLLWIVFGFFYHTNASAFGTYGWAGHGLLLFILLFLLGWHDFGFIIHQ